MPVWTAAFLDRQTTHNTMRDHKCLLPPGLCDDACALLHQSPGKLDKTSGRACEMSFESFQLCSKSNETFKATARDMRIFCPWRDVAATPQSIAIPLPRIQEFDRTLPTLNKEMACEPRRACTKQAFSLDINRCQFPGCGDDKLDLSPPAGNSRLRSQSFDVSTLRRPESFDFERHGSPGIRQEVAMAKALSTAQIAEDDMVGAGAGAGAEQLGGSSRHPYRGRSFESVRLGSSSPDPNLSLETATKLGLASVKWLREKRCRCSDSVPDASCSTSGSELISPDSPTTPRTSTHAQCVCSSSTIAMNSSPSRSRLSNASFAIELGESL